MITHSSCSGELKGKPVITNKGFSLVEVVMAVAIAALGIITVLGLIPGSLSSIREASEITSRTRIIASISSEIQMSDWGNRVGAGVPWSGLSVFLERKWSFDDQANLLGGDGQDLSMQQAYLARIRLPDQRISLSGQQQINGDLVNLIIDIATVNDPQFNFDNTINVFSAPIIVARRYATGQ